MLEMNYLLVRLSAAAALVFALTGASDATANNQQLLDDFKDTRTKIVRGDAKTYKQAIDDYKDSPLLPYIRQAAISSSRIKTSDKYIEQFKRQYAGSYLAELVHREQLRDQFKSKRYSDFLSHYKSYGKVDLQCMYLRSLYKTNQIDAAYKELPSIWLTGRSLPDVCDPIFNQWIKDKRDNRLIWQRAVLAFESRQYKLGSYLTRKLTGIYKDYGKLLTSAYKKPVTDLRNRPSHQQQINDIVSLSTLQLARKDADKAIAYLDEQSNSHQLPAALAQGLKNTIAYRLSFRDRQIDSDTKVTVAPGVLFSETASIQARNAMLRQDFDAIEKWVKRIPDYESEFSWRYWLARVNEERGNTQLAHDEYKLIAGDRSYYGFLAANRLGTPFKFNPYQGEPLAPFDDTNINRAAVDRIKALYLANDRLNARREAYHFEQYATNDELLKLAVELDDIKWHHQSILSTIRGQGWDHLDLRFPIDYQKSIAEFANMRKIRPTWIMAVIRQESALDPNAVSHANAYGLMQIIEPTAKEVARKIKISYRRDRLFDPNYNIRIGTGYIAQMREEFGDHRALISTAYNAGPHRTRRWSKESDGKVELEAWIEAIPFTETRRYTQNIYSFDLIYRYLTGGDTSYLFTPVEESTLL